MRDRVTATDVMTAMVAGFASGDLSRVHDLVAHDYVDHQGIGHGAVHGPDGFRHVVSVARSGFSELTTSVLDTVAEGDKVVARIEWRGIRTSGETERRETIDILRVVNGKAVEHWGARS